MSKLLPVRRLMVNPGAGNAALDQGGSQRGEEQWSDSDCILKGEATGFADGLGVRDERRGVWLPPKI